MNKRRIYVASSWRNDRQAAVVNALRCEGHQVYDFKYPHPTWRGFQWSDIDVHWQHWTPEEYRCALSHPLANRGFELDRKAMEWADIAVLVLPCGRSAHLEAGWFVGAGKQLVILLAPGEPELMYKLTPDICLTIEEVIERIR